MFLVLFRFLFWFKFGVSVWLGFGFGWGGGAFQGGGTVALPTQGYPQTVTSHKRTALHVEAQVGHCNTNKYQVSASTRNTTHYLLYY